MFKKWIVTAFLLGVISGDAQPYINYSEKDGLPSNHVYKITQDVDGFIWIATDEGLVKYNGYEFKTFTTKDGLPTNDIYNIYPARDGKLWYVSKSTSLGYIFNNIVYDFKTKKEGDGLNPIMTGFTGNEIIPSNSNTSNILNSDNQWEEVEYNIDKNYLNQQYLLHYKYKGVAISNKDPDKYYLISKDKDYIKIKDSIFNIENYYRTQITDSLFVALSPTDYSFINLNNLKGQLFTYQEYLGVSNLNLSRIHLVNEEIQLSGENVVAILGNDLKPKKTLHIPKRLKSHFSFIDKENTVWIASFTNGFYKYSLDQKDIKKELSNFKINDVKRVNKDIIALVNNHGFYKYDALSDNFKPYITNEEFLYDSQFIKETNTSYFISKNKIQLETNELISKKIIFKEYYDVVGRSLCYYDSCVYGYNTSGVVKTNPNNLKPLKYHYLNSVRCITTFKNRLVIGVSNGLYELKNDEFDKIKSLSDFKNPVIDVMPLDNDHLLVCTGGYGIYVTDLNGIEILEGSEFLKANNPCFIDNELYIPTNEGIYKYQFQNNKMKLDKIWNNTFGLPTNKINGVEKVGHQLLVATNQGIIHLPLDYDNSQQLQNIFVENAIYDLYNVENGTSLKYVHEGDLQVTVNSIDFRENRNLNYDFRLLPTKENWTTTSSANIRFSDLAPDKYALEIRSEGIQKSFEFTVVPIWYQTWWFYGICFLGFVGCVVWITRYFSEKSVEKRNLDILQSQRLSDLQLKALRSQMNPHFVFNSLNAIQYYINENDFHTSDTYLVKFSRLVREFFELSKEQFITVEREIKLLKNYLDLEKLRFKSKFNYAINVDPALDIADTLPSMLLQPIVENAVNHGVFHRTSDGMIEIDFKRINNSQLTISIKDNGLGYQSPSEDKRYKSSSVLEDRLKYLRNSGKWQIELQQSTVNNDPKYPGHQVIFHLKRLKNENL